MEYIKTHKGLYDPSGPKAASLKERTRKDSYNISRQTYECYEVKETALPTCRTLCCALAQDVCSFIGHTSYNSFQQTRINVGSM